MCTAVSYHAQKHYFGRNLDLEYSYRESVVITPRNYPFHFRHQPSILSHLAIIGIATVSENYPLYYDGTNEAGLSVAGLNFSGYAYYPSPQSCTNILAPFELIPWILCQCKTVKEAKFLLQDIQIAHIPFSEQYTISDLHWIISDSDASITVEPTQDGLIIMDNPIGILTNNPPFPYHLENLRNYLHLTKYDPVNHFIPELPLHPYSHGMGALGLPGDFSSASRFIRAAFVKEHSVKPENDMLAVNQFFHILNSVSQPEGCIVVNNKFEKTIYSSCCNTNDGIFYYTTYENHCITEVRLCEENLSVQDLICYPLKTVPAIVSENKRDRP